MKNYWLTGLLLLGLILVLSGPAGAATMDLTLTSDRGIELDEGETFLLQVDVAGAADLLTLDLQLRFDPDLLEAVADRFTEGQLLQAGGSRSTAKNQVDNSQGTMRYVASFLGAEAALNGSGTLVAIAMRARQKGTAGVAFVTGAGRTRFLDSTATAYIPYTATNLTLVIGGATLEPPPLPLASPEPGEYSDSVSVTLAGVAGGTIFYTLDGSLPVLGQSPVYTAPIELAATTTIHAVDQRDGQLSGVAEFTYTVTTPHSPTGDDGGNPADHAGNTGSPTSVNETGTSGNSTPQPESGSGSPPAGNQPVASGGGGNTNPATGAGSPAPVPVILPVPPPAAVQQAPVVLSDLQDHWAADPINNLVSRDIVKGFPDGSFKPEEPVTRAQFAVILVRALGLDVDISAGLEFADAGAVEAWAAPSIAAAVQAGLVSGYEDNTFQPGRAVTRAEVAVMIMRVLRKLGLVSTGGEGSDLIFADAAGIPGWARAEIAAAYQQGIVTGLPGNRFGPEEQTSRAQAATMVWRMLERQE